MAFLGHLGPLWLLRPVGRDSRSAGISSFPSYHPYSRFQAWCIYGIIYHYAPFLLSNPIVTFSGPNSTFLNQGLKYQHPFQRRSNQLISLTSYGSNQKTLQGSQPPVSAGVGLAQFIQDYSRAIIKRYYIISISCQGIKYSILLGQLNSSVKASFNKPVWSWPNWAIPSHSSNFKMVRTVFPDSDNTVIDPPARINTSVFTYTGYLSSPGDFFPS
ncbi:hypothetical protein O181_129557 [Austropuccinia psidii MF-1]|uniref:Uncharacterized protein n=1 Tax=Austropuccinia psidii MF-1 TaxID=1389203 RepID=A0A9Q3KZG8_9BASI|nr:hypothetical protein [Austropuccinia psidii MF-1]